VSGIPEQCSSTLRQSIRPADHPEPALCVQENAHATPTWRRRRRSLA
jgi:hypothetical protein